MSFSTTFRICVLVVLLCGTRISSAEDEEDRLLSRCLKRSVPIEVVDVVGIDYLLDEDGTARIVLRVNCEGKLAEITLLVADKKIKVRAGGAKDWRRATIAVEPGSPPARRLASALSDALEKLDQDKAHNARLLELALLGTHVVRYREWKFPWSKLK